VVAESLARARSLAGPTHTSAPSTPVAHAADADGLAGGRLSRAALACTAPKLMAVPEAAAAMDADQAVLSATPVRDQRERLLRALI